MSASYRWTFRLLAAFTVVVVAATSSSAQIRLQPRASGNLPPPPQTGPIRPALPNANPQKTVPPINPFAPIPIPMNQSFATTGKTSLFQMPAVNSWPGIPMTPFFRPAPLLVNPAIDNPWMNQVTVTRVRVKPGDNPFLMNPLLANRISENPFAVPDLGPYTSYGPQVTQSPATAIQQPGMMMYQGPDLQVNPTSGTTYQPVSGIVTLADGSTFYRVPGSGQATATGNYVSGSGLYYNPLGGTFFHPASGVLSKPAFTNIFLPYVW